MLPTLVKVVNIINNKRIWQNLFSVKETPLLFPLILARGVPIIRSAIISATDMVIFTNFSIGTEQQEDRYCYRYLYSNNSLYIKGLYIGFLCYLYGSLVSIAYCSLWNNRYTLRRHINAHDSSVCCYKGYYSLYK